jgi:hypothetical protein
LGPEERIESIVADAVLFRALQNEEAVRQRIGALVARFGAPEQRRLVNRLLLGNLQRLAALTWSRGWQPADLTREAGRRVGELPVRMLTDVIAAQMRAYPAVTVDRRWDEQVRSIGAVVWWERDDEYLDRWAERAGVDRADAIEAVIDLRHLLERLPRIELLGPLPGAGTRQPPAGGSAPEPRMLNRIRALLAKAESTEFPEEAEAFTAKAQELIARHSIDAALLAATGATREEPAGCRIGIDRPYPEAKSSLLHHVASANRCRTVWCPEFAVTTVFGFDADLRAVEMLYTSLLVQATTAMTRAGSRRDAFGQSRTRSFRQAFLSAFAVRIGERLRGVAAEATRDAVGTPSPDGAGWVGPAGLASSLLGPDGAAGPALLPVLAAREEAVQKLLDDRFPDRISRSVTIRDREGWASGRAAADRASLHTAAGHLPAD